MAIMSGGRKGPKMNGGRSHSQHKHGPREASPQKKRHQLEWRIKQLLARIHNKTFNHKNLRELESLAKTEVILLAEEVRAEFHKKLPILAAFAERKAA